MSDTTTLKLAAAISAGSLLGACGVCGTIRPSAAQEFDCRNAELASERAICGSDTLSSLDERTSALYADLKESYGRGYRREDLKAYQRQFLDARDSCGRDAECIKGAISTRSAFSNPVFSGLTGSVNVERRVPALAETGFRPAGPSSLTRAKPLSVMRRCSAARCERSITRPGLNGPRSLMRTTTLSPLSTLVTRTRVPKGSVRWGGRHIVRIEGFAGRRVRAFSVIGGKALERVLRAVGAGPGSGSGLCWRSRPCRA